jgi:hypothetical protein
MLLSADSAEVKVGEEAQRKPEVLILSLMEVTCSSGTGQALVAARTCVARGCST